jgi:hypothetical protein
MTNGFPYFQFHVDRWLTGKISAFDLDEQALFLHFCMLAWASHGPFSICLTTVQRRFRKSAEWLEKAVAGFSDVGIIAHDGDKYRIKFIDDQLAELTDMRVKRSEAGKKSAEARAFLKNPENKRRVDKTIQNNTSVLNTCSTHVEDSLEASRSSKPTDIIDPAVIFIPVVGNDDGFPVTSSQVEELKTLYPAVDVPQTLREIRGWNLANKARRKTARGVMRHVNAWMAREQNGGR